MKFTPLPFRSSLNEYEKQAMDLLSAWREGDADAIQFFRENYPPFLDERITWLPKNLSDTEIKDAKLDLAAAQVALAHGYSFQSWARFVEWIAAVTQEGSLVSKFESAVECVISGEVDTLQRWLRENPQLVQMRSSVVTHFDPPEHKATLLHYIAANGVECYRQKSPANAVDVAKTLLDAGAEVDALAAMYGGECTTMSMLVSSTPPAQAGVQVALVEVLVDYGAAVESLGVGEWTSPLNTALTFGFIDAAQALVRRGAQVRTLASAAGLGRLTEVRELLANSTAEDRHRALALAAQLGHADIVRVLLDAGEDPSRYNPKSLHAHGTPLHHAALAGHVEVVKLLVERGAKLDIKDTIYHSTPLGWAQYAGQTEIANYLRTR